MYFRFSVCVQQTFRHVFLATVTLFLLVSIAPVQAAPQAVADIPYLGLFINIDNRFYFASTRADALSYQSIENDWAFVVYSAAMSNCQSAHGLPLGNSRTFLIYGLHEPALPLSAANYQTFSDAIGAVAVLSARSIPGDVYCLNEIPVPVQYDNIYSDGFGELL